MTTSWNAGMRVQRPWKIGCSTTGTVREVDGANLIIDWDGSASLSHPISNLGVQGIRPLGS